MFELAVDNEEEIVAEEEELEEENKDNQNEYRSDWIIHAEMSSNATIIHTSDLRSCDMNWNYDWLNDGKQHYEDLDLADANNFLQQAQDNEENKDYCVNIVNYNSLNEKQEIILRE